MPILPSKKRERKWEAERTPLYFVVQAILSWEGKERSLPLFLWDVGREGEGERQREWETEEGEGEGKGEREGKEEREREGERISFSTCNQHQLPDIWVPV